MTLLTGHKSKYGSHLSQLQAQKEKLSSEHEGLIGLPTDDPSLRERRSSLTRQITNVDKMIAHEKKFVQGGE